MKFEELGLSQPLLRAVSAEGYTTPTPIQAEAIPHLLTGRDLMGCAQTGTGKTAAFALPILHRLSAAEGQARRGSRRIRVLVLAPTRELASQISESFRVYGRNTPLFQTVVYGGVSQNPQVRALRKGVDILVATPGRLVDLMNQGHIDLAGVDTFVLDEADRMLDMGFLPDLRRVIAKLPGQRQTILFSATMPSAIDQLAKSILRDPVEVRIAPAKVAIDLVEQSVCHVRKQSKVHLLIELLKAEAASRVIVFTRTKRGADRVAHLLTKANIRAEAMHGNKSQAARERTMSKFKSNHPPILVATDLAARGIDVDGVSHVFNFDLPEEAETYVHRIGRTGRAGAAGIAISFCDPEERSYLKGIERLIRQTLEIEDIREYNLPKLEHAAASASSAAPHGDERRAAAKPAKPPHAGKPHAKPHAQPYGKPLAGRPASGQGKSQRWRKRSRRPMAAASA